MGTYVAEGVDRFVWHHGTTAKRKIDPVKFHKMSMPSGFHWRALVVGVGGALEYDHTCENRSFPAASYPVWHLGDPIEDLWELASNNIASDPDCELASTMHFKPMSCQEHRVVLVNVPDSSSRIGNRIVNIISEIQKDNPSCILHLFEAGTYRSPMNARLASFDIDAGIRARLSEVLLPNGRRASTSSFDEHEYWFRMLGITISDAKNHKEVRLRFNIRSARWAAKNWHSDLNAQRRTGISSSRVRPIPKKIAVLIGDKIACDHCSLFDSCKQARDGGVCNLPEAETVDLAKFFNTRDADTIIEGLGAVLQAQAERAEAAIEWERESEKLDPELTKILRSMADGGEKLAKLLNPQLAGPKIALQINQGSGSAAVVAPNMKILMASAVKELEDRGVPRADITPDLVMRFLTAGPAALTAASTITDVEVIDESEPV